MTEPRLIAEVTDYNSLQAALRQRVVALNISYKTVDNEADLTPGHANKLLSTYPIRALGRTTLGPMLAALGIKIVIIEDPAAQARITAYPQHHGSGPKRVLKPLSMGVANLPEIRALEKRVLRDLMRKNGRKGGKARKRLVPKGRRTRIARKAAKARWSKPKIVEITNQGERNGIIEE